MKIQSKKTKLFHTVTKEDWEKIKGWGDASKYIIVSNAPAETPKPPEDTNKANYQSVLKDATKAFGKKNWEKAKELYLKAQAIKPTALIKEKLAEIDGFLDFKE